MRRFRLLGFVVFLSMFGSSVVSVSAKDVYVNGYYRRNGTYVRPHVRSSPDAYRWNNYGPSRNEDQLLNPQARDSDGDGVPNYLDRDDNNNGIPDDRDSSQYSR